MANKLYEENYIQSIADAIRSKNGSTKVYTVSEMASEIENIQTGTTEENRIVYTGTIAETVVGSQKYATLVTNSKLAEHRNDESLFVRVDFEVEAAAYTIIKTWGANSVGIIPGDTIVYHQTCMRYASDGSTRNKVDIEEALNNTSTTKVGALQITEDGELRIYSNSSNNYAIRPSNYTVTVEW